MRMISLDVYIYEYSNSSCRIMSLASHHISVVVQFVSFYIPIHTHTHTPFATKHLLRTHWIGFVSFCRNLSPLEWNSSELCEHETHSLTTRVIFTPKMKVMHCIGWRVHSSRIRRKKEMSRIDGNQWCNKIGSKQDDTRKRKALKRTKWVVAKCFRLALRTELRRVLIRWPTTNVWRVHGDDAVALPTMHSVHTKSDARVKRRLCSRCEHLPHDAFFSSQYVAQCFVVGRCVRSGSEYNRVNALSFGRNHSNDTPHNSNVCVLPK